MVPAVLSNIIWVCATAGFHDDLAFIQAAAAAATNSSGILRGQVAVLACPACNALHLDVYDIIKHIISLDRALHAHGLVRYRTGIARVAQKESYGLRLRLCNDVMSVVSATVNHAVCWLQSMSPLLTLTLLLMFTENAHVCVCCCIALRNATHYAVCSVLLSMLLLTITANAAIDLLHQETGALFEQSCAARSTASVMLCALWCTYAAQSGLELCQAALLQAVSMLLFADNAHICSRLGYVEQFGFGLGYFEFWLQAGIV